MDYTLVLIDTLDECGSRKIKTRAFQEKEDLVVEIQEAKKKEFKVVATPDKWQTIMFREF